MDDTVGSSVDDSNVPVANDGANDTLPAPEDAISATATVRYIDLEGGFYGLVTQDSVRYQPVALDEAFRQDGLTVRFRAVPRNVMTAQMWGTPIEIIEIERLKIDPDP
ncbi:hypothetical protein [Salisaeta longa]|uniref:hypothetical protein n=1 Tax=Salisaeta longa TaxID=503170 RepID=UPI0003B3A0D1|nr:hypothetical protein [Salisaeta longa]